jgi:hypothetical protein
MKTLRGYFARLINVGDAYADLIAGLTAPIDGDPGLYPLMQYQTGTIDIFAADPRLAAQLDPQKSLTAYEVRALQMFALRCIASNLQRYGTQLLEICEKRLQVSDTELLYSGGAGLPADVLSHFEAIKDFTEVPVDPDAHISQLGILMEQAALNPPPDVNGETGFNLEQRERMVRILDPLRTILNNAYATALSLQPAEVFAFSRLMGLRCAVALASLLTSTKLRDIRAYRLYRLQEAAVYVDTITDLSVAALPAPTEELIALCQRATAGRISSASVAYVQAARELRNSR